MGNFRLTLLLILTISTTGMMQVPPKSDEVIRLGFLGNSMIYYNDCPRLVEQMLKSKGYSVQQDSCLRGGATIPSLWERGNGMKTTFASAAAALDDDDDSSGIQRYDIGSPNVPALLRKMEPSACDIDDVTAGDKGHNFIIFNDHTQSPARKESRSATARALKENYIPALQEHLKEPLSIIFIQTPAYRFEKMRGSEDLGDFAEFTRRVLEGYQSFVKLVHTETIKLRPVYCHIAPVGEAFSWVRQQDMDLFAKLYNWDDFHPSPHGTWLQACILYCIITQTEPPEYRSSWWDKSRYIVDQLPRPTAEEAEVLRKLAYQISETALKASL